MDKYIANAYELLVLHKKTPLLDVNMARVLERYFGPRKKYDIRYDPYLQELSYMVVNHEKAKEINWAILDYAQLVCRARNPICNNCLINNRCSYYKTNGNYSEALQNQLLANILNYTPKTSNLKN